jgi:hypothetical protein
MKKTTCIWISAVLVVGAAAGYFLLRRLDVGTRSQRVVQWITSPGLHPDWAVQGGTRCTDASFLLPTSGFVGYLWDDTFKLGSRHQGIDIFGGTGPGQAPVFAAYSGYLTRLPEWKSSVIIRLPQDPRQPAREIWTYYTHMADPQGHSFISTAFPPGTSNLYVAEGALLGYQGNYSGDPNSPVGVHLHFSIVLGDGRGGFKNELQISNTIDPSLYFNLPLNASLNQDQIPVCQ